MAQLTTASLFSEEEEKREGLTTGDLFGDVPSESQFTREHGQEAPNLLGRGADLIKHLAMDPIPAVQEAGEGWAEGIRDTNPLRSPHAATGQTGVPTGPTPPETSPSMNSEALAKAVEFLTSLSRLDYATMPLMGGTALLKGGIKAGAKLFPRALSAADRTVGLGVGLAGAENVMQGNLGQGALELALGTAGIHTGGRLKRTVAAEEAEAAAVALDPLDRKMREAIGEAKTAAGEQDILNVELHTRQGEKLRPVHKEFVEDPSMGQAEYQRRLNVARRGAGEKAALRPLLKQPTEHLTVGETYRRTLKEARKKVGEKPTLKQITEPPEPRLLRGHLTPDELDQASFRMTQHPWAKSEDFTPARAQDAITKWNKGEPLQPSEIKLFTEVFGDEAGELAAKGMGNWETFRDLLNMPRAVMASGDMSAVLRQNLVFSISRPITSMKALAAAAPSLMPTKLGKILPGEWGEDAYQTLMRNNAEHSAAGLAGQSKLATTGLDDVLPREEQFMSSIAETLPIIGPWVRASGRFHVGFLNKVRLDVFGDISRGLMKSGFSPKDNPELFEGLANYVNVMTGRGGLGGFERSAKWLNGIAFSPRFASSRLQMTGAGDAVDLVTKIATLGKGGTKLGFYSQLPAPIRKEAMRDVAATMGVLTAAFGLMKLSPDIEVETNWRSADFAKGRVGKTRIDIGAGTVQYLRLYAQIAEAGVSSLTADPGERWENFEAPRQKLTGQLVDESPMQKVARAAMYKESPTARAAHRALGGEDPFPEGIKEFAPLAIQDFTEALEEHGLLGGAAAGAGAFFGLGLQTYDAPDSPEVQAREQKAQAQGAEARERAAWRRAPDTRTPEQRSTERLERSDKALLREDVNDVLRNLILQGEDALARRLARLAGKEGLRPDLKALAAAVGRQQMEALTEGSQ